MTGPRTQLEWLLGYFTMDWGDEYERWEDVVDAWLTDSSPEQVRESVQQISELLPSANDSEGFATRISHLGCDFDPRPDEGGYKTWLTAVRDRLLAALLATDS